jgi:hypothetical protein
VSASATGNRETPKRAVSVALSSTAPGGSSNVTIDSRKASTIRSVAPAGRAVVAFSAGDSAVDFILTC